MIYTDTPSAAVTGWTELQIQVACLDMLRLCFPRLTVFAVPNGSRRTVWQAVQAKREGMLAGVSDLVLTWTGPMAAFVEIKARDGRISDAQSAFLHDVSAQGFIGAVIRHPDSLFDLLREAGAPWSGVGWRLR